MKYLLSVIFIGLIIFLTFIDLIIKDIGELFVGGTIYSFFEIFSTNLVIKSILALIVISLFFVWFKQKKSKYFVALVLAFILWFLSGKTMAFNSQDGQIISGWFYFKTNDFKICAENDNCENVLYKQTSFEKKSYWRIKIKHSDKGEVFFISPFIWNRIIVFFEEYNPNINK